jgi:hypothetical protein
MTDSECDPTATVTGCDARELTVSSIVVSTGPVTSGGLNEPSAAITNLAGRIAPALPFEDGIDFVVVDDEAVPAVCGGAVRGADAAVGADAVAGVELLFDPAPHPASGRSVPTATRTTALIDKTSAADN